MTEHPSQQGIADNPAQAFESLREEISLLHKAIKGLTAEREDIPDYAPTLGALGKLIRAGLDGIARIEQAPAVALTPAALARDLNQAAVQVRAEDKRQIDEALAALHKAVGRIDGLAERARSTATVSGSASAGSQAALCLPALCCGRSCRVRLADRFQPAGMCLSGWQSVRWGGQCRQCRVKAKLRYQTRRNDGGWDILVSPVLSAQARKADVHRAR
jgi:hypothetical protein